MVSLERVTEETALVRDLGAESIDFLDLIFRLEEALATPIPPDRWQQFVAQQLPGADLSTAITTRVVVEFVQRELAGASQEEQ